VARTYSIAEARDQLPSLVRDAEQGASVSLTRRGKPVAVLLSVAAHALLTAGLVDFLGGVLDFRARHDLPALRLDEALEGTRDTTPPRELDWG